MIEESFYFEEPYWPNDDLWAAHYQVLTGYDDAAQRRFIGQDSFHGADQEIPYETLDEILAGFQPGVHPDLPAGAGRDRQSHPGHRLG